LFDQQWITKLIKSWRGLKTRTSTDQPQNHRTDRTRDRQKTCQQRGHGSP